MTESRHIDPVRRRRVADTPEERVRQAVLRYLIDCVGVPRGLITVEIDVGDSARPGRADIVVHDRSARPWMVVECKAPGVKLSQDTVNQAARYNRSVDAPYVLVTNGKSHLCAAVNESSPEFLSTFPEYPPGSVS